MFKIKEYIGYKFKGRIKTVYVHKNISYFRKRHIFYERLGFIKDTDLFIIGVRGINKSSGQHCNINACYAYDNGKLLFERWMKNNEIKLHYKPAPKCLKQYLGSGYYECEYIKFS